MSSRRGGASTENGAGGWEALGTRVELRVCDRRALERARGAVDAELAAIDLACSRFRTDSELSRVNGAGGRPVSIGPLLAEALEHALRAAELTDGDVDPTVGGALELAGYDRDFSLLRPPAGGPPAPAVTVRARSGWQEVELDRAAGIVRVPAGIHLDLGASAKAWAADRAAQAAARAAGCAALVAVGGDVASAGGAPAGGWRIRVTDDVRSGPQAPGQTVTILSGGLATSSTRARRWSHAGHTMHHLIDPRTGVPASSVWRTASVAAATCTDANIAATAALLRGSAAIGWLQRIGLPARLVGEDGSALSLAGWPEQDPAMEAA